MLHMYCFDILAKLNSMKLLIPVARRFCIYFRLFHIFLFVRFSWIDDFEYSIDNKIVPFQLLN